ncbi:hypothetical protein LSTR_LSTR016288 [Laodelphax striatellus]|uniref:Glucosylceramidase n=1 Tax=Laodelphax striatellus TaxID=195883 RepID=A0A482WWJ3_LAOST|nr:hypothetical protein LSTR_LSTR016288 [Laodelphax striatellus]
MLLPQNEVFLLLAIIICSGFVSAGLPCELKPTDDGFVCVCNATFCDTIEPLSKPADNNAFVQYTTSKAGKVFEVFHGSFNQPDSSDDGCHITIEPQEKYQEIFGFGGSFTDAAGINIASLSEGAQHKLMSCYFGRDGIGYTFGRVPIGGSDFSTHPYTLADDPNDLELENFKLAPEDYSYKVNARFLHYWPIICNVP